MIAGLDMYSEIAEGNSSHVGVWQKAEERESCRDEASSSWELRWLRALPIGACGGRDG
jgi:hypothetical protein